jgi:hypothetical protein
VNDLGKTRCRHCGELIHSNYELVVQADGSAVHEACQLTRQLEHALEVVAAYQDANARLRAELRRLERGSKSPPVVQARALPTLLGGIIETPFYGCEDEK